MEPEFIARGERFEAHIRNLPVGQAYQGAIERADAGGAQSHLNNRARDVAYFQRVSHAHRLIGNQRDAGDDVLEGLLRGQRDGDAADSESSERTGQVDSEVMEDEQQAGEQNEGVDQPAAETQYGIGSAQAATTLNQVVF